MEFRKMVDVALADQRVLIRQDLNVPVKNGQVTSMARLRASLPTLRYALEAKARVMVMSHLGRPKEGEFDEEASLAPVAAALSDLLGMRVPLVRDWIDGVTVEPGQLVLCENVRFLKGEGKDIPALAKKMAALCDVYVMDAFGTAHRAQASTHGVGRLAPIACAGLLLTAELEALTAALEHPKKPLVAIIGGAKVSTKITVIDHLLPKIDQLILGGGIANTFLAAAGHPVGISLYEADFVDTARQVMAKAAALGVNIPLPTDVVVARECTATATATVKPVGEVADEDMILDVGPETTGRLAAVMAAAGTIVWNGPLGVFELEPFACGTEALAQAIAESEAFSLAGGGETLEAIDKFGVESRLSYISTGGGALMEFLEGQTLPAVAMLQDRAHN